MSHVGIPMQDQPSTPHRRRGPRLRAVLLALLIIAALVAAAVFLGRYLWGEFGPTDYADYEGSGTGSAVIVVEPGDSVTAIGNTLADNDVVASVQAFVAATEGDPRATSIAPGAYQMRQQMSAEAAFELILDPAARYETQVTLPEGLRLDQTVSRTSEVTGVAQEELLAVASDPAQGLVLPEWAANEGGLRAEGFLFPATYAFAKDAPALEILQSYVDRFEQAAQTTGLPDSEQVVGYSPYEVLIIASLIQAEGDPNDFGRVSRVVYNRLDPQTWGDTNGFLQLDATINYANAESRLNISSDQLRSDGPYNTYTRTGLPPTPINSPGEDAIRAALNPEDGDWLYYVTVNPGTGETKFTDNYTEFLGFKAEFERWCDQNPGEC